MKKYTNILRFRFDDETAEALKNMSRMSDYVRSAVRDKLELDGFIPNSKIPF